MCENKTDRSLFPSFFFIDYPRIKRTIDVLLSSFALVFFAPLFMVISLAVKLESEGPVFFCQQRRGLKGRVFTMYKFRSMYVGAEKGGVYEKEGDKRVTRAGRLLRSSSIDELPQLFNIIRGDMSIIGPRPVLTYHPWVLSDYTEFQRKRFNVRPGITGWAQVNGRKDVIWKKRIEYDVHYVENMSFLLDMKILWKTIIKVVSVKDNVNIKDTL